MLDKNNPLWLPPGSVRAIIALIIVITTMVLFVVGTAPGELVAVAATIVGFYFTQRNEAVKTTETVVAPEPPVADVVK